MLDKVMSFLEVSHLRKSFVSPDGGKSLVVDVENFSLSAGDLFGMRGESGSGKTTFLHLLAGILRPDEGSIILDGTEVSKLNEAARDHLRASAIGYVFQSHNLIPVLTAYENIELPLLLLPLTRQERRQRVQIAMQAVDLMDRANHYPRQLSGGQEQRVGIGRAIVADPRVVVADEPTGDLDRETSEQILDLLVELNSQLGTTLLMVTHDIDAAAVADRQLLLIDGKLVPQQKLAQTQGAD